jgi:ELM2 domain
MFAEKIRVGKDFQASIPAISSKPDVFNEKALLVWSPANHIPESKLEEYITLAKERYGKIEFI